MAVTFVAPHSLHARPLVIPRSLDVLVWNRTAGVPAAVLIDGHEIGRVGAGERVDVRLAPERSLLATLPEATFVSRYRESFTM
jgi:NAD kinase